ncbi:subtilisin-like proprotein convertase family protein [Haloferula luteola]|uniref:Subtilisin-like proprotein convertase family protein n=1 Tax=Haloferula luteola TaxID=595692 RepID=A0A840V7L0_9BACT|nr:subtilisin-like proprotein convertase family protein [Haloferula luteola]
MKKAHLILPVGLAAISAVLLRHGSSDVPTLPQPASSRDDRPSSGRSIEEPAPFQANGPEGASTSFDLILDRVLVRGEDGKDEVVVLDPVATKETLARRISEMGGQVLPLCRPEAQPDRWWAVTRDITVRLADGVREPDLPAGLEVKERPDYAPGFLVLSAEDPMAALAAVDGLRDDSSIAMAEVQLARQHTPRSLPNDPLVVNQWQYQQANGSSAGTDIGVEPVWAYGGTGGIRGGGVVVGVVDDGVETGHPDFVGNIDTVNDWDWNGNDDNPNPGSGDDHGTACAGNVAARGNNGIGVTGTAPEATLVGMRLIAAATTDSQEASAMNYLPDLIDIKSNSWGPADDGVTLEAPGPLTRAAFANAAENGRGGLGTIFVWAAGNGLEANDNSNYDGYANDIHTIAVTAVDSLGRQSYYAEPGANILVAAPSDGSGSAMGITTTDRSGNQGYNTSSSASGGDYTDEFGGTSSATPVVSGVVALMLERNPSLGWRDVQEILIQSAAKFRPTDSDWTTNGGGFHFNHKFGAGLVDAEAAVALADSWTLLEEATTLTSSLTGLSDSIPDESSTGVTRTFDFTETNVRCEQVEVTLTVNHTFRGDLAVTLTSPSGTVSRLAENHEDGAANYSAWTFTSVRHWGESSTGVWTLKVADLAPDDTGTLKAASITLNGTVAGPVNPAPTVTIDSPTDGQEFSPGSEVEVLVSATDLTGFGEVGTVASVELRDGGTTIATDTTEPFSFTFAPAEGEHVLTVLATDSEGARKESEAVTIQVKNRAPIFSGGEILPVDPAYSDEDLVVTGLVATDPEGADVTVSYDWQYSTDGLTWHGSGETSDTLPAEASRAGKLWLCRVTASDGNLISDPLDLGPVNVFERPVEWVEMGSSYAYTSGLVLRGDDGDFEKQAIVNEFSQSSSGLAEWVEILMLRRASLRNWSLMDAAGNSLTFADSEVWDDLSPGTLVVVYYGLSKDSLLPADDGDATDGALVVSSTDTSRFTGTWPGYSNSGDAVLLKDASGAVMTSFSYGSATKLALHFGGAGISSGKALYYESNTESGLATSANWTVTDATTIAANGSTVGVTPAAGNPMDNAAFVADLRSGVFGEPAVFRLADGVTLPEGLTFAAATGTISGTITGASGAYPVTIERANGFGEVVSQSFTLTVTESLSYQEWIAGFTLDSIDPTGDPDGDGYSNLLEYYFGSDPGIAQALVTWESVDGEWVLSFPRQLANLDVDGVVEWSDDLVQWQTDDVETQMTASSGAQATMTATVPAGTNRRFVRIRVE